MLTRPLLLITTLLGTQLLALAAKPTIATTNYPLTYFAERLAGDFAEILYEIPADEDPAFWKPSDEQIARIQQADLIVMNGATYEKWAATAPLPLEGIVNTSLSFRKQYLETAGGEVHSHGDGPAHSHGGTAFTLWLDLQQANQQAEAIAMALHKEFPDQREAVSKSLAALTRELADLDKVMKKAAAGLQEAPVLASHPIYQYWARAYGVQVEALEWEPDMKLDEKALADLAGLMKENPRAKYFLWEGTPAEGHSDVLAKKGLTSIIVSPCFSKPGEGDFLSVMKDNAARIADATAGKP